MRYDKFRPFNRYIQVEPIKETEGSGPTVLVPEDYKVEPKHMTVKVIGLSDSCKVRPSLGEHIIIESSMVEELTLNRSKYYLVLENYVLASLGVPKYEDE